MDLKTVLAVDDDPDLLELVCLSLGTTGHHVLAAASGAHALDQLDRHPVDLVVLDVMMPGMSGLEVARRVRSGPAGPGPAILMLSALGAPEDVERATAAGADDYLTKPFAVRELVRRSVSLLSRRPLVEPAAG
jgi:DNA-binding response OmpR family regulator